LESEENSEDELDEQEFPSEKVSLSNKLKSKPKMSGKMINFDQHHVPKGDKESIDKFVSYRISDEIQGKEEVLVKYKVFPF
jgi:hypothetical protein